VNERDDGDLDVAGDPRKDGDFGDKYVGDRRRLNIGFADNCIGELECDGLGDGVVREDRDDGDRDGDGDGDGERDLSTKK